MTYRLRGTKRGRGAGHGNGPVLSPDAKRLPRYPLLLATLLGRLAVDERHRGAGLGTVLLLNALRRALRSEVASMAVLVDAKDDGAAAFYRRHDFQHLPDHPRRMFLPMAEVAAMFAGP